jgi:hypothetical protein
MKSVLDLISEIKKCEAAGATTAAVTTAFICIDTMAFFGLPAGKDKQSRADFIAGERIICMSDKSTLNRRQSVLAASAVLGSFASRMRAASKMFRIE